MKAALLVEPGRIEVEQVADPQPGPGEVAIAVGGVGLCGSDMSVFSGRWTAPSYPWIMGHEAFGTVVEVGRDVSPDRVGETVVVEPNFACFECHECGRGWTSGCQGRVSVGMNRPGALAERLVIPARYAWAISGVPEADLACVEPATVVVAALRRLGTLPPDAVAVVGVGAQGLMMTLALVDRGVEVHVHDVSADRIAFAESLGARSLKKQETRRFDLVVDTVGSPSSTAEAIDRVEVGGTLLYLGLDDRPLDLTAQTLVRRQLVVRGTLTYDHPQDFETAVALVAEGFRPGRIITDEYTIDDVQRAFERNNSSSGKTWIRIAEVN